MSLSITQLPLSLKSKKNLTPLPLKKRTHSQLIHSLTLLILSPLSKIQKKKKKNLSSLSAKPREREEKSLILSFTIHAISISSPFSPPPIQQLNPQIEPSTFIFISFHLSRQHPPSINSPSFLITLFAASYHLRLSKPYRRSTPIIFTSIALQSSSPPLSKISGKDLTNSHRRNPNRDPPSPVKNLKTDRKP